MKAMILAAGKGTRLQDITEGEIPKPMVDMGKGPLLEHTLNHLVDYGVDEIVINLHFKGDEIRNYFGGTHRGVKITYTEEDELLGTAGGVKNAENYLDERFILVYGDILTDLDFDKLAKPLEQEDTLASMLIYQETENLTEAGILLLDEENRVQEFLEKPSQAEIDKFRGKEFWANGAVFMMEPEILEHIPKGFSDFSRDIFPELIENDEEIIGVKLDDDTYWHEIGNPKRYRKGLNNIKSGRINFKRSSPNRASDRK